MTKAAKKEDVREDAGTASVTRDKETANQAFMAKIEALLTGKQPQILDVWGV